MHSAGEREVAGAPESNGEANDTATVPLGAVVSTMKVLPDKITFPQGLGKNLSQIRLIHQNGYISSPTQKHSRKYVNTQLEILKDAVYLFLHEHLLM